jgi:hypothetical protein
MLFVQSPKHDSIQYTSFGITPVQHVRLEIHEGELHATLHIHAHYETHVVAERAVAGPRIKRNSVQTRCQEMIEISNRDAQLTRIIVVRYVYLCTA